MAGASNTSVTCWGGTQTLRSPPVNVLSDGGLKGVVAGSTFTCVLGTGGVVSCWGAGLYGEVTSLPPAAGGGVTAVAAGSYHGCLVKNSTGEVTCWGRDDRSQVSGLPASLAAGAGAATRVTCGGFHCCAWGFSSPSGNATCWGANDAGQSTLPANVFAAATSGALTSLCAGGSFTCALLSGTVSCWGSDAYRAVSQVPLPAKGGTVQSIACGAYTACAVYSAASAANGSDTAHVCWGGMGLASSPLTAADAEASAAVTLTTPNQLTAGGGASKSIVIRSGAASASGPSGGVSVVAEAGVSITSGAAVGASGDVVLATGSAGFDGVSVSGGILLSTGGAVSVLADSVYFGNVEVNATVWAALAALARSKATTSPSPLPAASATQTPSASLTPSRTPSPTASASGAATASPTASGTATASPPPPFMAWTRKTQAARVWGASCVTADGQLMAVSDEETGVWVSSDGGVTFTPVWFTSGNEHYLLTCHSGSTNKLCIAGTAFNNQGILCTSDTSGNTWGSAAPGTTARSAALAGSADGTVLLLATAGEYLWLSNDEGNSWSSRLTDALRDYSAAAVAPEGRVMGAAESNGALYHSLDGGATWNVSMTDTSRAWAGLALSSNGSVVAAVVRGVGVYVSNPSALSSSPHAAWELTLTSAYTSIDYAAVAITADGQTIAAVANGPSGMLQVSTNRGGAWSFVVGSQSLATVALSGNGQRLVAAGVGPVFVGTPAFPFPVSLSLAQAPASFSSVSACRGGQLVVASAANGCLVRSLDFGVNWEAFQVDAARVWKQVGCWGAGAFILAAAGGGSSGVYSYRPTDTTANATFSGTGAMTAVAASANGSIALVADEYFLWVTNSSSPQRRWFKAAVPPAGWASVAVSADGGVLLAAENALWRSVDKGANWTRKLDDASRTWKGVALSANGSVAYAAGASALYVSRDGGSTWAPTATAFASYTFVGVACSPSGELVIAAARGTPHVLLLSTDWGQTWSTRGGPGPNKEVTGVTLAFDESTNVTHVYAVTTEGVWGSSAALLFN